MLSLGNDISVVRKVVAAFDMEAGGRFLATYRIQVPTKGLVPVQKLSLDG